MKVYCPYCKKEVDYKLEKRKVYEFKGTKIDTFENIAICKDCNNDLYVNELEEENTHRIYKAYRKKENLIDATDIIKLREKYNISQRELTLILGFGKMTINRYENGGLPTKSQSDYIRLLIENEDRFIAKVKEAYSNYLISKKTYEKIVTGEREIETNENLFQNEIRKYLDKVLFRKVDIFNGYKEFELDKVENIISYVASKVNNLTLTSLNKYLWYIDMLSFKRRGVSITGLTYENQKYGPTIIDKKYNEILLLKEKYKKEDIELQGNNITKIISNGNYDLTKITDNEKDIINTIIKCLKNKKVTDISELSHKEDAYKKTKRLEKISFEYAVNLKLVD